MPGLLAPRLRAAHHLLQHVLVTDRSSQHCNALRARPVPVPVGHDGGHHFGLAVRAVQASFLEHRARGDQQHRSPFSTFRKRRRTWPGRRPVEGTPHPPGAPDLAPPLSRCSVAAVPVDVPPVGLTVMACTRRPAARKARGQEAAGALAQSHQAHPEGARKVPAANTIVGAVETGLPSGARAGIEELSSKPKIPVSSRVRRIRELEATVVEDFRPLSGKGCARPRSLPPATNGPVRQSRHTRSVTGRDRWPPPCAPALPAT